MKYKSEEVLSKRQLKQCFLPMTERTNQFTTAKFPSQVKYVTNILSHTPNLKPWRTYSRLQNSRESGTEMEHWLWSLLKYLSNSLLFSLSTHWAVAEFHPCYLVLSHTTFVVLILFTLRNTWWKEYCLSLHSCSGLTGTSSFPVADTLPQKENYPRQKTWDPVPVQWGPECKI